ncbi:Tn3 family transposase [Streptosporangium roseum]|uniref:Tn3 family transposase n=1 Tax=Streptosporangium roseum TaxID=2001 RepID=UPI0033283FAB
MTQVTNRNEAFHGFADWLMFGGKLIGHNGPDHQEKVVKFNELIANCVIYSTACDITDAANALAAEGHPVDTGDLANISPYITHTIRRFGNWTRNLAPPDQAPPPGSIWNPASCSPPRPPDRSPRGTQPAVALLDEDDQPPSAASQRQDSAAAAETCR